MKICTFIVLGAIISLSSGQESAGGLGAVAVINVGNGGSTTTGSLEFRQLGPGKPVVITGEITGLEPNSAHGFHIHNSGDVRNGCTSTGGHFNPHGVNHGGPKDETRHVGDLGNIMADANGSARVYISDYRITLCGPNSIIGRAVVIHSGPDDFGRGGTPDSLKTGNAGSRIGCGLIGIL